MYTFTYDEFDERDVEYKYMGSFMEWYSYILHCKYPSSVLIVLT